MEKKFYVFACVSMILLMTGISIFTRFVDGYYGSMENRVGLSINQADR